MEKLSPTETELIGTWTLVKRETDDSQVCRKPELVGDEAHDRITHILRHQLKQIATDKATCDWLYVDPGDSRLWELKYRESEVAGGGPIYLRCVSPEYVKEKYGEVDAR